MYFYSHAFRFLKIITPDEFLGTIAYYRVEPPTYNDEAQNNARILGSSPIFSGEDLRC